MVTSTLPYHTTNRTKVTGIDIGQLGRTHLLTFNARSLRLTQGYMSCLTAYRHRINRDTLQYIIDNLKPDARQVFAVT
jgi:hypothetical protein